MLQEIRYAFRQFRKTPVATAVAVLSLALGIGANTAIFTLIESTLLRPIAVKHPQGLRLLTWREQWGGWVPPNLGFLSPAFGTFYEQRETADGGLMHTDFPPALYREFLRSNSWFDSLFAFKELGRVTAVVDGNAEAVNCFLVGDDFYRGMEITPAIGRALDGESGGSVLISYEYWTRRFARNPGVIGKTITVNAAPLTIVGVNPEYFTGIEPGASFEIWAPLSMSRAIAGRSFLDAVNAYSIPMMARLKPGASDTQVQSALDSLFQAQVDAVPGPIADLLKEPAKRPRLILQSAARGVDYLTMRYDRLFYATLALAALVLLIACANVANLMLVKSAVRQREISLRLALGARRSRIVVQLLTEGLLLASIAGVAGLLFAYWTRRGIPALLSTPWRPTPFDTTIDGSVLLAALGMTFLTGLLFSLAPIWYSRRVELNEALKDGSRASAGFSKLRIGRVLVVFQIALCILVLAGAGLCVKTFTNLRRLPVGFEPRGVLLFSLDPPLLSYPAERVGALLTTLQERLSGIPGIQSVSLSGNRGGARVGRGAEKPAAGSSTYSFSLDAGNRFFETMGIPMLHGRATAPLDRPGSARAAVVNQAFARRFFGAEDPTGETFTTFEGVTYQIVGVCADWRVDRLRDAPRLFFYPALMQQPRNSVVDFELRIGGDQARVVNEIRDAVRSVDPNLAVFDVRTASEQIQNSWTQERLLASLAAIFGALALLLASIGIYGVLSYAVARRTNEIGIRIALGARTRGIVWLILRETLILGAIGAAIGLPAVFAAGPLLDRFLASEWRATFIYGLKPNDPLILGLAALTLASAGFLATYVPARRAARIDPMEALRHE